jgi:NADP-dependent 3-hydroxy acid dehydrogenase YdfG
MRILVTWGSKRGGTAGIGAMIAETLTGRGFDVVAAPIERVTSLDGFKRRHHRRFALRESLAVEGTALHEPEPWRIAPGTSVDVLQRTAGRVHRGEGHPADTSGQHSR